MVDSLMRNDVKKFATSVSFGKPRIKWDVPMHAFVQETIDNSGGYSNPYFMVSPSFCDACGRLSPKHLGAAAYKDFLSAGADKFCDLFNSDFGSLPADTLLFIPVVQKHAQSIMTRYKSIKNDVFFDSIVSFEGKEPNSLYVNEREMVMEYTANDSFYNGKIYKFWRNGDTGFVSPATGLKVVIGGLEQEFEVKTKHRSFTYMSDFFNDIRYSSPNFAEINNAIRQEIGAFNDFNTGTFSGFCNFVNDRYGVNFFSTARSKSWKYDSMIRNVKYGIPEGVEMNALDILTMSQNLVKSYSKLVEWEKFKADIMEKIAERAKS